MKLPNATELETYAYQAWEQEILEAVMKAVNNLQTSTRLYNSPVWERSSMKAERIWNDLKSSLNSRGYTVTFDPKSSSTIISWA